MSKKYPRTAHLPSSPGFTSDDVFTSFQVEGDVIITEKMDGENTTMTRDVVHARSVDSTFHESRAWVRALHGQVKFDIPKSFRVCGENLYALHSVEYKRLPSYFQVFNIWDGDTCLSWQDTEDWCKLLGLTLVPVLYKGPALSEAEMLHLWKNATTDVSEGFVVRSADAFAFSEFTTRVAKWVRKDHVQTSTHWMHQEVKTNTLAC